jgi:hypothetical protein
MPALSNELIEKFLSGLCTEEDASLVWDYLQEHPDERILGEEYELAEGEAPLPEGYREEMLAVIRKKTEKPRLIRLMGNRPWRRWAVAACILLMAAGGWWWNRRGGGDGAREDQAAPLAATWIGRYNPGNRKIVVVLPDSTKATLSPGATIRYRRDLGHYEKREVRVDGQALFAVARNREMPFIVYSEGLSTTVLGTVFQVTAEKGGSQIRVRLLEGKVMVGLDSLLRGGAGHAADSAKHYYLSPGEELVYNKNSFRIAILDHNRHGGAYANNRVLHIPMRPDSLANWYMFNNQHLSDVFDQLSVLFNVEIQYTEEDLRQKYFIGKLEKKDSLSKILRDIALLNHLLVTNQNGRYIIKRQKP